MTTTEQIQQFQSLAREAIAIYGRRIAFYSDILEKLQDIINQFGGGENK